MHYILEILDREAPSGNAIFLVETATGVVIGGNRDANETFTQRENEFDLLKILKDKFTLNKLLETAKSLLIDQDIGVLKDLEVETIKGETFPCHLNFMYATDDKKGLLVIVKIQEDWRPYFQRILLDSKQCPAFILNYEDELLVKDANQPFYDAFICNASNIEERYQRKFELFIDEKERTQTITKIYTSIQEQSFGLLDASLQTAQGERLKFYFSKNAIKHLLGENSALCMLVPLEETLHSIEYPYDKKPM